MAKIQTRHSPFDKTKPGPFVVTFLISMALWLVLSGKFDYFHISLGIISCVIVSASSSDLLFPNGLPSRLASKALGFICYLPWLMYQILLANLHVLYLSLHPKLLEKINPQIVRFNSKLKTDISLVTLANSITLTPGTITIFVSIDGEFKVHAIDDKLAKGLPGEMEERIAKAFEED